VEESLTLIEKTAFLSQLPVLASVPTEALAQLASQAREKHHDAGDVVFNEGDTNTGVLLVVDGLIELRKGRALVRMIGPGQTFG
jgi:CRP-like cAMP-binding protein